MKFEDYFKIEGITYTKTVSDIINRAISYCYAYKYKKVEISDILIGITIAGKHSKKILADYGIDFDTARYIGEFYCYNRYRSGREFGKLDDIDLEILELLNNSACNNIVNDLTLLKNILEVQEIITIINRKYYAEEIIQSIVEKCCELGVYDMSIYIQEEKIEYTTDMTYMAYKKRYQRASFRETEINRIEEILNVRKKCNPVLVGEAGVGKTCIVEELCNRLVEGRFPSLSGKRILSLDITSMIAGTKYRGDFEGRIVDVIKEVIQRGNIILFVDEMHAVMGAGGAEGALTLDQILKPYLTRGEISIIGATTFEEYRKHIEKDSAYERRFNKVVVNEPSKIETQKIVETLLPSFEEHYTLSVKRDVIGYLVDMSQKYLPYRNFPDKAIDVLEETCAKVKIRCTKNPKHAKVVTRKHINEVIAQMSGVPLANVTKSDIRKVLELPEALSKKVIGQPQAVEAVSRMLKISKSGIGDQTKPTTFLFFGPTGVGKTEMAKCLAEELFGTKDSMIRFDMSEYAEKASASKLIGSAPGYVGYEESGKLVKEVKKHPYSILLFDEIEKASPDIFNMFLQIFDDGILTDASGKTVNFKNTIIIMTSNLGYSIDKAKVCGFNKLEDGENYEALLSSGISELEKTFRPEFLNRIDDIVLFKRLELDDIICITGNLMQELKAKAAVKNLEVLYDESVLRYIAKSAYDEKYGARPLKRYIERNVKLKLADFILSKETSKVKITVEDGKLEIKASELAYT